MGILEKIVSGGGRILNIIKLIIKYDIPIVSGTALQTRTEMITEGSNNNLITILENRALNSELSDVLEDFKNITVNNNNNDVKELQLKKRKRNKYYYTKDITHGFQSNITSNKKMDIIKYIQLLTQWRSFNYMCYRYTNAPADYLGLQIKILNKIIFRIRLFKYYSNRHDNLVKLKINTKKYW